MAANVVWQERKIDLLQAMKSVFIQKSFIVSAIQHGCHENLSTKGAILATPLFLFTSGDDKLNSSKYRKHQKIPHQED